MRRLPCWCGLLVLAVSCSREASVLKEAGGMLFERPDSVVLMLSAFQPSSSSAEARRALLLSMALEGVGEVPQSDSLARVAFDYYSAHGPRNERMHAANCLAGAEYACGHYTSAILHYHDALRCAAESGDVRMEGYICQRLSELFALSYDHSEALSYAKRAVSCLASAGESLAAAYSGVDEARQYLALGETVRARQVADSLQAVGHDGDKGLEYYLHLLEADIHNACGNDSLAVYHYRQAESTGYMLPLSSLGQYLLIQEESGSDTMFRDSVLAQLKGRMRSALDSIVYQGVLMEDSRLHGDYRTAFLHLSLLSDIQNRSLTTVISQGATHALKAYFEEQYRLERMHRRNQILLLVIVIMVLAFLALWAVILLRKRRLDTEEQMAKVEDLNRDLQVLRSARKHSEGTIATLVQDKIQTMARLTEAYFSWTDEAFYQLESAEGRLSKDQIVEKFRTELKNLRSDKLFLQSLEDSVNATLDGAMEKLRRDFSGLNPGMPKFKETDYLLLLLFFSGFSNKSVSFFSDLTDEAVRTRKKRYKQCFSALPAPMGEFYLGCLTRMSQLCHGNN